MPKERNNSNAVRNQTSGQNQINKKKEIYRKTTNSIKQKGRIKSKIISKSANNFMHSELESDSEENVGQDIKRRKFSMTLIKSDDEGEQIMPNTSNYSGNQRNETGQNDIADQINKKKEMKRKTTNSFKQKRRIKSKIISKSANNLMLSELESDSVENVGQDIKRRKFSMTRIKSNDEGEQIMPNTSNYSGNQRNETGQNDIADQINKKKEMNRQTTYLIKQKGRIKGKIISKSANNSMVIELESHSEENVGQDIKRRKASITRIKSDDEGEQIMPNTSNYSGNQRNETGQNDIADQINKKKEMKRKTTNSFKQKRRIKSKIISKSANNSRVIELGSDSEENVGQDIKRRKALKTQTKIANNSRVIELGSDSEENVGQDIKRRKALKTQTKIANNSRVIELGSDSEENVGQDIKRRKALKTQTKIREAEQILFVVPDKDEKPIFVVKWKGIDYISSVKSTKANYMFTQLVIQYYQSKLTFKDNIK